MANDARDALAREAQRLREEREAAARDLEARRHAAAHAQAEAMQTGSTWLMCKAVARPIWLWVAFVGFTFTAMMGFNEDARVFVILAGLVGIGAVVWFGTGTARWRLWRSRVPFGVEGDVRVLRLPAAVTRAHATASFREFAIPQEQLVELVQARLAGSTVTVVSPRTISIGSPDLDREGSNWPVAGWFRRVVRLYAEIHAAYPIETVSLDAQQTDEFYVPSGD